MFGIVICDFRQVFDIIHIGEDDPVRRAGGQVVGAVGGQEVVGGRMAAMGPGRLYDFGGDCYVAQLGAGVAGTIAVDGDQWARA